jgi:hypothetical protein
MDSGLWRRGGGAQGRRGGETGSAGGVTWREDIAPIVEARCAGCHTEGGVGPFELDSYDAAKVMAGAMAGATAAGRMPPWPPDESCNDYRYSRALTDEQIELVQAWSDAGAPEGSEDGEAIEPVAGMSRVDVELEMESSYTPTESPDEYRCFVVEWPESGTTYITGFGVRPGEDRVVHHVVAFGIAPEDADTYRDMDDGDGYACQGGPGGPADGTWLGGWVPGASGQDFPQGTGLKMEEGSVVVLQMHYNLETAGSLPDQSTVTLSVEDSVEKEASIVTLYDPDWVRGDGMLIPAGETATFKTSFTNDYGVSLDLWSALLHMHELGSSGGMTTDAGCLLQVNDWDFHWQGSYILQEALVAEPEDTLWLTCTFDNTAGTEDVTWGEGTSDEMCLATVYGTASD